VLDVTFVDSVEFESVEVIIRVELLEDVERALWDVAFVDSVESESVEVIIRVELVEDFERALWATFVMLRTVPETLAFPPECAASLVTVELLVEELVSALWGVLVTLRPVLDTLSFALRVEAVPVISGLEPNAWARVAWLTAKLPDKAAAPTIIRMIETACREFSNPIHSTGAEGVDLLCFFIDSSFEHVMINGFYRSKLHDS